MLECASGKRYAKPGAAVLKTASVQRQWVAANSLQAVTTLGVGALRSGDKNYQRAHCFCVSSLCDVHIASWERWCTGSQLLL